MSSKTLTALELFCGIGGFASAVAGSNVRVVAALDQSRVALDVYRLNFPGHAARQIDLERVRVEELTAFDADLWWLSPPCQPYSVRGCQRDLEDPRARSLLNLLTVFPEIPFALLPGYLVVENVTGFARSAACGRLKHVLASRGYQLRERLLCPAELGVPSRRPRYYLVASRRELASPRPVAGRSRALSSFLAPVSGDIPPTDLLLSPEVVGRFGPGLRILDPANPAAYTTCFTAGYGKSLMHAGSYLADPGGVRRFAPAEIAALLGFPETFRFPAVLSLRKRYQLLGNSLSVFAVQEILSQLPELAWSGGERPLAGLASCLPVAKCVNHE